MKKYANYQLRKRRYIITESKDIKRIVKDIKAIKIGVDRSCQWSGKFIELL